MSGPIVRTGATPAYSENWEKIFGKKPAGAKKKPEPVAEKPKKSTKKK